MNKIPSEEESDESILVLTDLEQFVLDTFDTVQDPEGKKLS
jgi:hypothetical protein